MRKILELITVNGYYVFHPSVSKEDEDELNELLRERAIESLTKYYPNSWNSSYIYVESGNPKNVTGMKEVSVYIESSYQRKV